ncbi:MAG: FAD-dependent oxidoreductase [Caldilineaceae bacterium]
MLVSNKAGLVAIQPQIVIDCTGDGDVAAWAGAPYEKAEPLQPMSLHFRIAYLQPSLSYAAVPLSSKLRTTRVNWPLRWTSYPPPSPGATSTSTPPASGDSTHP